MKKMIVFMFLAVLSISMRAADGYHQIMMQSINTLDTSKTVLSLQSVAATFEQISKVEKTEWMPLYYVAYSYVFSTFLGMDNAKKDEVLAQALTLIDNALKLKPNDSELLTLKAFQRMSFISVDPMQRGMQYSSEIYQLLGQAQNANPNNPRIYYLKGMMLMNTPAQFGGGADKGLPLLKQAIEKFNTFEATDSIAPHWGKAHCLQLIGNN